MLRTCEHRMWLSGSRLRPRNDAGVRAQPILRQCLYYSEYCISTVPLQFPSHIISVFREHKSDRLEKHWNEEGSQA